MGFFDDKVNEVNRQYMPLWQYVDKLSTDFNSDVVSVIDYLKKHCADLPVYKLSGLCDYAAIATKDANGSTPLINALDGLNSYINRINTYIDEHFMDVDALAMQTLENPNYFDYVKISELPTFGDDDKASTGTPTAPPNADNLTDLQKQLAKGYADITAKDATIAELQQRIDALATAEPVADAEPLTLAHTTLAVQILHDVIDTHWQNYNPRKKRTTTPKQDIIIGWIKENYPESQTGITDSMALWIDRIARFGVHQKQK